MFSAEKGLHNVAIASLSDFGVVLAAVKHWDLVTLVRTGHLDTRCTPRPKGRLFNFCFILL